MEQHDPFLRPLGFDPKQDVVSGLPAVTVVGPDWIYTFTKPDTVTDVVCTVEVSTDLANWTTVGVAQSLAFNSGGIETWEAKYPLTSATNLFFRLKVTR